MSVTGHKQPSRLAQKSFDVGYAPKATVSTAQVPGREGPKQRHQLPYANNGSTLGQLSRPNVKRSTVSSGGH